MSGFVITLDAILAITVAGLMIGASGQLIASRDLNRDDHLVRYGYDLLSVAEKSGYLDNVTAAMNYTSNLTEAKLYTRNYVDLLRAVPESMCAWSELYFQDGTLYYHADSKGSAGGEYYDPDCAEKDKEFVSVSRAHVYKGNVYYVVLRICDKNAFEDENG